MSEKVEVSVRACPMCNRQEWHRQRGPDCMFAVCRCGFGYDIGWGYPRPEYFPEEAKEVANREREREETLANVGRAYASLAPFLDLASEARAAESGPSSPEAP